MWNQEKKYKEYGFVYYEKKKLCTYKYVTYMTIWFILFIFYIPNASFRICRGDQESYEFFLCQTTDQNLYLFIFHVI